MKMLKHEHRLSCEGFKQVAGCDEVGRGPLAGPVVCAAVILDPALPIAGLADSKQLSEKKRHDLDQAIRQKARAYAVVFIDHVQVDALNVYQASKQGMLKALAQLRIQPDFVLTDAMPLDLAVPTLSLIKGDQQSASIAAASILAKVARDAYMIRYGETFPDYGFERHKGYPTRAHLDALRRHGPTPEHRRSFAPVKAVLNSQQPVILK